MRSLAVGLLLFSLFAITFSRDLQKRYANLEGDGALLDAFARALGEGRLERNDRVLEAERNLEKRWWLASHPWGKK